MTASVVPPASASNASICSLSASVSIGAAVELAASVGCVVGVAVGRITGVDGTLDSVAANGSVAVAPVSAVMSVAGEALGATAASLRAVAVGVGTALSVT